MAASALDIIVGNQAALDLDLKFERLARPNSSAQPTAPTPPPPSPRTAQPQRVTMNSPKGPPDTERPPPLTSTPPHTPTSPT
jgi:hypothetical protein